MSDIYIALGSAIVSGGMALLGVWLSNRNANLVAKRHLYAERQRHVLQQKESLYYKIFASLDMAFYENRFIQNCSKKDNITDEDIEISLQLYASNEVIGAYHHAMEAVVANLPVEVIVPRLDVLREEIRKDLGIEEAS